MTNPNQPLPNAHPGSDDAHAAPMTPNSVTLTGAGDRFEERLQSTLKKARLARDRAERTLRKRDLWLTLPLYALLFFSTLTLVGGAAAIGRPSGSPWLLGDAILTLILGVLLTVLSFYLLFAWLFNGISLQHAHKLELFICELEAFIFAQRHHALVDPIEKKVAGYPERLMVIMDHGEQRNALKSLSVEDVRKTENRQGR